jgi:hypothetical protein
MSGNQKSEKLKMNRGWQWLLYIDVLLPLLLFLAALVPIQSIQNSFSRLFHTYSLYVMNTIPDFKAFTGIVGLAAHLYLIGWAAYRKRWVDLAICVGFAVAVTLYFYFGLNYLLVGMLNFGL